MGVTKAISIIANMSVIGLYEHILMCLSVFLQFFDSPYINRNYTLLCSHSSIFISHVCENTVSADGMAPYGTGTSTVTHKFALVLYIRTVERPTATNTRLTVWNNITLADGKASLGAKAFIIILIIWSLLYLLMAWHSYVLGLESKYISYFVH